MSVISVENVTLTLLGHVFLDFVSGDILELTPQNDYSSQIVGTNGGVNLQKRSDGDVHDLTMRFEKHTNDDVFMNTQVNAPRIVIFSGSMKENFVRDDIDGVETYILEAGTIITLPTDVINDLDGNATREYVIRFRTVRRNL